VQSALEAVARETSRKRPNDTRDVGVAAVPWCLLLDGCTSRDTILSFSAFVIVLPGNIFKLVWYPNTIQVCFWNGDFKLSLNSTLENMHFFDLNL
jgi:hypothetical protein